MTRWREYLLRLAVSLALLAALFWSVDPSATYRRLLETDLRWLSVSVACFTLMTVLMAWRWQITARSLGAMFGIGFAVREYYLSQLVNLCLPGGVLGDAGRAVRAPRGAGGLSGSAHAVMIERLAGQAAVALVLLGGAVLALLPGGVDWPGWLVRGALWGSVCLGILGAGIAILARFVGPFRRFVNALGTALLAPDVVGRQLALSLVIALLMILAFWAAARGTGTVMSVEAALVLVPLILSAMMIPVSVGGWGLREGAAAALFPIIGAGAEAGVAAGVAYGLALLIASVPGLLTLAAYPRQGIATAAFTAYSGRGR